MGINYKVSVIIPVYNMEKTVERCISSVLRQTYKNIEIIVVNDGSIDKSKAIIDEMAQKDKRLLQFNQENMGLSIALKTGLRNSTGEYVLFIDSDDYIDDDMVEDLVSEQIASGAEVVQTGVKRISVDGKSSICSPLVDKLYKDKKELYISYFIENKFNTTMAGNLIKKSLFNGIKFIKGALSLDLQIMPYIYKNCNYMKQTPRAHYNAIMYPDSVSRGKISDAMYDDCLCCSAIWESFLNENAKDLIDIVYYRRTYVAIDLYSKLHLYPEGVTECKSKVDDCVLVFRQNYRKMVESFVYKYIRINEKIKFIIFGLNPKLYLWVMHIYEKCCFFKN